MVDIHNNHITLTRGDSFSCSLELVDANGESYAPASGDEIVFSVKRTAMDRKPRLKKIIPNDSLVLDIIPSDTMTWDFGNYIYDIKINYADGNIETIIADKTFTLGLEVHNDEFKSQP